MIQTHISSELPEVCIGQLGIQNLLGPHSTPANYKADDFVVKSSQQRRLHYCSLYDNPYNYHRIIRSISLLIELTPDIRGELKCALIPRHKVTQSGDE